MTEARETLCESLRRRAEKEPLGADISDYSDEWCAGFLAGQVNGIDAASDAIAADLGHESYDALLRAVRDERSALRYISERYGHLDGVGWERILCGCSSTCGDDGDIDGPGTCKGLPRRAEPLVEVVLVPRRAG